MSLPSQLGKVPHSLLGRDIRPRAPVTLRNSAARLLDQFDRLDLVTDLKVVELPETDTGLEVGLDLGDVVLEATQRVDGEVVADDHTVADHARLGVARDRSRA